MLNGPTCSAMVGSAGWVGTFTMEFIFFLGGDFKFISVQIACEGPSGAGGGIMGSG